MVNSSKWSIRDGNKTSFWLNNWLKDLCLKYLFNQTLSLDMMEAKVFYFVNDARKWNCNLLSGMLPPDMAERKLATQAPAIELILDVIVWRASKDRAFCIKSAYNLLSNQVGEVGNNLWKKV